MKKKAKETNSKLYPAHKKVFHFPGQATVVRGVDPKVFILSETCYGVGEGADKVACPYSVQFEGKEGVFEQRCPACHKKHMAWKKGLLS